MNLYTVTIRGRKYYFSGDLNAEDIKSCELFCLQLESQEKNVHPKILFESFLHYIDSNLKCAVSPINVEHVFRINF